MGCRLPKLRKAEDKHSPGNIYSTLRRPQVETKVGVAYTYHFLDFLLGKEEVPVSSVLCLSSVRELPVQVRELYAQGFVLVAVHPFVHHCSPSHAHIQKQLHRAVLVRETQSSEKSHCRWSRSRLETDVCVAGQQAAGPDVIQSYVKRIQDAAEQGVTFAGFLQQPGGGAYVSGHWDPEELSSLHSSPSPIHRHPFSTIASPTDPEETYPNETKSDFSHCGSEELDHDPLECDQQDGGAADPTARKHTECSDRYTKENSEEVSLTQAALKEPTDEPPCNNRPDSESVREPQRDRSDWIGAERAGSRILQDCSDLKNRRDSASDCWLSTLELQGDHDRANEQSRAMTHNNNHIRLKIFKKDKEVDSPQTHDKMQLFALYNHCAEPNSSLRFYALRVPLRVQRDAGLITEVDANWLDHMTQHFSSGARLVDGFFDLTSDNDTSVSSVDSVFIFQRSAEDSASLCYDAIVVEQWTVVDGVVVKTDYIPLLQSLAPYGWRLMCVLPTPIVKMNSDGSLSTKQILFLQRPILQRKRKDFKMLNLRGRSKAKKSSAGEAQDEQENRSLVMETEMDRLRFNAEEEEEEEEEECGGNIKGSLQRDQKDALHQKGFLLEHRCSDEHQEEETDVDRSPSSTQEKAVRWTDFCQRCDGGVRVEERIKQQLFSGVC